jgi:hypothetical protein
MDIEIPARDGFTFAVSIEHDDSAGLPWENEDGHGPVSDWRKAGYNGRASKAPGELLLCDDNPSGLRGTRAARFYDYATACKVALRDQWGVAPYRLSHSCTMNGIYTVSAHWFEGRELLDFTSCGDDLNSAIADCYRQHKATFPSARAYAAAAARADYDRLRRFCDGDWHYLGLIVTASRNGIELASASLWGLESDCGDYLDSVARELSGEALEQAQEQLEALCDCEGAE